MEVTAEAGTDTAGAERTGDSEARPRPAETTEASEVTGGQEATAGTEASAADPSSPTGTGTRPVTNTSNLS